MKSQNTIILLLSGLMFSSVGIYFVLDSALPMSQSWYEMRTWKNTEATLLKVTTATNKTEAKYNYSINGINYKSTRVYVAKFNDGIGDYHKRLQKRLKRIKSKGQKIQIWYNPYKPDQTVIDRDMRWGLFIFISVFCLVFILFGLSLVYSAFTTKRETPQKLILPTDAELKKEWDSKLSDLEFDESFIEYRRYRLEDIKKQQQPAGETRNWQDKKEWALNRISSNRKSDVIGVWMLTFALNGGSAYYYFYRMDVWSGASFIGLIFPLIGLLIFIKAVKLSREWNTYGPIHLIMDPFPGSIGGHLGGILELKKYVENDADYMIKVECVYSNSNENSLDHVRWSSSGIAKIEHQVKGARLHFRFDLPGDLPESDLDISESYVTWKLTLEINDQGHKLRRQYEIPVFKTSEQSKYIRHNLTAQTQEEKDKTLSQAVSDIKLGDYQSKYMTIQNIEGVLQLYFPLFRNKPLTVFSLIVATICGFAIYALLGNLADNTILNIVFIVISLPFGLVFIISAIAVFYIPLNTLTVRINFDKTLTTRRLLAIPIRKREFQNKEASSLEIAGTGSSGRGANKISYYKIIVNYAKGSHAIIAENIVGKALANQLSEFLFSRIQKESTGSGSIDP